MAWLNALRDRANGMPIVVLLALALVLAGGSHRLQAQTDDPALQAYLDAGGTLAELCSQSDPGAYPVSGCPLCVLAHFAVLPQVHLAFRRAPTAFRRASPAPRHEGLRPRIITARHGIRAPPSLG